MPNTVIIQRGGIQGPGSDVLGPIRDQAQAARDLSRAYAISDTNVPITGAVLTTDRGSKYYADKSGVSEANASGSAAAAASSAASIPAIRLYDNVQDGVDGASSGAGTNSSTTEIYLPSVNYRRQLKTLELWMAAGGASSITIKRAGLNRSTLTGTFISLLASPVFASAGVQTPIDLSSVILEPGETLCLRRTAAGSATWATDDNEFNTYLGPTSSSLATTQAVTASGLRIKYRLTWNRIATYDEVNDNLRLLWNAIGDKPANDTTYYYGPRILATTGITASATASVFVSTHTKTDRSGTLDTVSLVAQAAGSIRIPFVQIKADASLDIVTQLYLPVSVGLNVFTAGVGILSNIWLPANTEIGQVSVDLGRVARLAPVESQQSTNVVWGTQVAWTGDNMITTTGSVTELQIGFTIKAPAKAILPAMASDGEDRLRGKTSAINQTFNVASIPANWTGTAFGFTTSGLTAPAAPASGSQANAALVYNDPTYSRMKSADLRLRINDTRATFGIVFGGTSSNNWGGLLQFTGTLSGVGCTIQQYAYNTTGTKIAAGPAVTVPWTVQGGGLQHHLRLVSNWFDTKWTFTDRFNPNNTISGDLRPSDGTASLCYYMGQPGPWAGTGSGVANDFTVDSFSMDFNIDKNFDTIFVGDSNLIGYHLALAKMNATYARLLNNRNNKGRFYVSARGGATAADNYAAIKTELDVGLKARYGVVMVSGNDGVTAQATWRTNMQALLTRVGLIADRIIICTHGPWSTNQAAMTLMNTDVLSYYFGRQYEVFDLGAYLTTNGDRLNWSAGMQGSDSFHFSDLAHAVIDAKMALLFPGML